MVVPALATVARVLIAMSEVAATTVTAARAEKTLPSAIVSLYRSVARLIPPPRPPPPLLL